MNDNTHTPPTPDQIVAEQITEALISAGLLLTDRASEFRSSLAAGQLKGEDWSLEIDLATAPKEEIHEQ